MQISLSKFKGYTPGLLVCILAGILAAYISEITVIPYICKTDNKSHRYSIDLTIVTQDDEVILVEIKPEKQTKPPVVKKRTKNLL